MNKTFIKIISLLIFAIGVILGVALLSVATWGALEASVFDSGTNQRGRIKLTCPIMINQSEIGKLSITIKNPTEDKIIDRVKIRITNGFVTLYREYNDRYDLEPGERKRLVWEISSQDAAYDGLMVLAKVRTRPTYPLIDKQGSCGVLVINSDPLTGMQTYYLTSAISLIMLITGIWLWKKSNPILRDRKRAVYRAMNALIVIIFIGIVTSLLGNWWVLGLFLLVGEVLLIGSILAYFISE